MNCRRFPFSKLLAAGSILAAATLLCAQPVRRDGRWVEEPTDGQVHIFHIRGPIYMLVGAGGNITASVGRDGVLLVDTGLANMTDKVLAAISELQRETASNGQVVWHYGAETRSSIPAMMDTPAPPEPIQYIIDTHMHPDHTGGNEKIAKTGRTLTGGNVAGQLRDAGDTAAIIAQQNVLDRMSAPPAAGQTAIPFGALPTDTYHQQMKLSHFFNGDGIRIVHMPSAHTDGDSVVYFRGSDVISAGDVFVTTSYPVIDLARGGSINGEIDALNYILDLAIPEFRTEGGTMVVPGHGRLSDSADVGYYRDMVTVIRDRIQAMIKKDMTLEQVKAARPTVDYDGRYGGTSGFWTTDKFIEAVYKSLSQKK